MIDGGCLCGQVRYQVSGELIEADNCHCSKCRRHHGAAFGTYADFSPGAFRWTAGETLVKIHQEPSGAGWVFCGACGSSLAASDNGKITMITLGTVDGDPGLKPESHIFVGSKAEWFEITDSLPRHQTRAGDPES